VSAPATESRLFEGRCNESIVVRTSRARAFAALHRVEDWPARLPHVLAIDVLYDDGQYQEFLMDVRSDGGPIRVRSVRNCRLDTFQIEFFQPDPPAFLRHHAGGWQFYATGPDRCMIVAYHMWNLEPDVAAARFPPTDGRSTEQEVESLLRNHSLLALQSWQKILEEAA
jgi:hypothetical protein